MCCNKLFYEGLSLIGNLSGKDGNMNVKEIAKYMVETGIEKNLEWNYSFYLEELAEIFHVPEREILTEKESILSEIECYEEVSAVDFVGDGFQIYYYIDDLEKD